MAKVCGLIDYGECGLDRFDVFTFSGILTWEFKQASLCFKIMIKINKNDLDFKRSVRGPLKFQLYIQRSAWLSAVPCSAQLKKHKESMSASFVKVYKILFSQGWEFALWFFERIARFLWAKERSLLKRVNHSRGSFVKSNRSESLSVAL